MIVNLNYLRVTYGLLHRAWERCDTSGVVGTAEQRLVTKEARTWQFLFMETIWGVSKNPKGHDG